MNPLRFLDQTVEAELSSPRDVHDQVVGPGRRPPGGGPGRPRRPCVLATLHGNGQVAGSVQVSHESITMLGIDDHLTDRVPGLRMIDHSGNHGRSLKHIGKAHHRLVGWLADILPRHDRYTCISGRGREQVITQSGGDMRIIEMRNLGGMGTGLEGPQIWRLFPLVAARVSRNIREFPPQGSFQGQQSQWFRGTQVGNAMQRACGKESLFRSKVLPEGIVANHPT